MIGFIAFSISIPFLSIPAQFAAILSLPVLLWSSRLPLAILRKPWSFVAMFGLLLAAVQILTALIVYRQTADAAAGVTAAAGSTAATIILHTLGTAVVPTLLYTLPTYGLFLSLGVWLTHRVPSAQLQALVQGILPAHPGFRRVGAIAGLAFSLFIRLRGIGSAVREAVMMKSLGKKQLRSVRETSTAIVRLGTELAISTAEAMVLRGYDPNQQIHGRSAPEGSGKSSGTGSLNLELAPLLIIALMDFVTRTAG